MIWLTVHPRPAPAWRSVDAELERPSAAAHLEPSRYYRSDDALPRSPAGRSARFGQGSSDGVCVAGNRLTVCQQCHHCERSKWPAPRGERRRCPDRSRAASADPVPTRTRSRPRCRSSRSTTGRCSGIAPCKRGSVAPAGKTRTAPTTPRSGTTAARRPRSQTRPRTPNSASVERLRGQDRSSAPWHCPGRFAALQHGSWTIHRVSSGIGVDLG